MYVLVYVTELYTTYAANLIIFVRGNDSFLIEKTKDLVYLGMDRYGSQEERHRERWIKMTHSINVMEDPTHLNKLDKHGTKHRI